MFRTVVLTGRLIGERWTRCLLSGMVALRAMCVYALVMATKIIEMKIVSSDLSGVEDDSVKEFAFSVDGKSYWIDLTPEEIKGFTELVKPYVSAARTTKGKGKSKAAIGSKPAGNDAIVRKWATDNGVDVNLKGRVQKSTREAYDAAHAVAPATFTG